MQQQVVLQSSPQQCLFAAAAVLRQLTCLPTPSKSLRNDPEKEGAGQHTLSERRFVEPRFVKIYQWKRAHVACSKRHPKTLRRPFNCCPYFFYFYFNSEKGITSTYGRPTLCARTTGDQDSFEPQTRFWMHPAAHHRNEPDAEQPCIFFTAPRETLISH